MITVGYISFSEKYEAAEILGPLLRPPQRFPRFPGFHHPAVQLQSEAVGQAGEVIEQAHDVGLFIAEWCGLEPV